MQHTHDIIASSENPPERKIASLSYLCYYSVCLDNTILYPALSFYRATRSTCEIKLPAEKASPDSDLEMSITVLGGVWG